MYDRPTISSCSSFDNPCRRLQFTFSGKPSDTGQLDEWYLQLPYAARVVIYIAILGVVVIVIFLILKFMSHFDAEASTERLHVAGGEDEGFVTETSPLLETEEPLAVTYGTGTVRGGGDEETASSSSSEDAYNAKLCVICYEERRNCFFIPCGHSATCRGCARKLMAAETRVCPICRRVIRKSRKLLVTP